jgi:hypothetical protein
MTVYQSWQHSGSRQVDYLGACRDRDVLAGMLDDVVFNQDKSIGNRRPASPINRQTCTDRNEFPCFFGFLGASRQHERKGNGTNKPP